ncbi:MAG: serine hydrolase [Woeseiaceae bacterium]
MMHTFRRVAFLLLALGAAMTTHADDLETSMATWLEQQDIETANLAIATLVIDGDLATHATAGSISPDGLAPTQETQFQIGSISKVFTNLLLAEMVAADKVSYTTTIGELLGDDFKPVNSALTDISLEALATHTSGLPRMPGNFSPADPSDPYQDYTAANLMDGLKRTRAEQRLQSNYAYSNLGVGLLGYLLGEVHGGGYEEAVTEHVIKPLGLQQTGLFDTDNQAQGFRAGDVVPAWRMNSLSGAGALWGSTKDFEQLAKVMLGQRDAKLQQDSARGQEIFASSSDGFDVTRIWHVAYADGGPIFWHNGGTGGFWSFFGFRPDTAQAVAIFVAGDSNPTNDGLALLGADEPKAAAMLIDTKLLGQYQLTPSFGIGVFIQDDQLFAQATGQPPFSLANAGNDWYALHEVDASVHFVREGLEVVGLELVQGGRIQSAERVADKAQIQSKAAVELPPDAFAEYVGDFALAPSVKINIRERKGGLEAKLTGQGYYPIFAKGDDVFFYKIVDAELHFERDADGAIDALVLHQSGMKQRAEKRVGEYR